MANRYVTGMTLAAAVIFVASCSQPGVGLLTAPDGIPRATPGIGAGAVPIALGQPIAETVTIADPSCGFELPAHPEPCRRFAVSVATAGVLRVALFSQGPDELTLIVARRTYWGTSIAVTARVDAGSTYEIAVSLHGGGDSQAFELTATLEPS